MDHRLGHWFIVTNEGGADNFKVVTAPVATGGGHAHWLPLDCTAAPAGTASLEAAAAAALPFSDGTDASPGALMVEGVACFRTFVAVTGRMGGFTKVRKRARASSKYGVVL